jgi:hypothetical protein
MSPKKQQRGGHELTAEEKAGRVCSEPGCGVAVPGAYTWLDPATQQPCYGTACEAEHLILHEWDFAHNADYAWEELQDIWPQLGDVHSLPACDSSSREASRASSRRTSMAGDV